MTEMLQRKKQM